MQLPNFDSSSPNGELSAYRVAGVTRIRHGDFQTFLRRHQTSEVN